MPLLTHLPNAHRLVLRVAPVLFVFLWSTGFIGAKYGLPYAEPLTFLLLRYSALVLLLAMLAWFFRAPWPTEPRQWFHLAVAGLLIHALYLGGVFVAIKQSLPAGVVSLLVGLQPLLTATIVGAMLGERVLPRQWAGLLLGLSGLILVLSARLDAGFGWSGVFPALVALLAITVGTLYQKRFCPHFDWRSGAAIQFGAAWLITLPLVWLTEDFQVQWTGEFMFALSWLVLVLSVGAIGLLNHLIRSGTSVNVASLFYLVPPSTAIIAWLMFGERLTPMQLVGLAVAVTGVALVRR
jgi:drug/metabolite transporter (DMT)-like permease